MVKQIISLLGILHGQAVDRHARDDIQAEIVLVEANSVLEMLACNIDKNAYIISLIKVGSRFGGKDMD